MLSSFNLWIVAKFEIKILLRSWFFRIFSGLSIFILTVYCLLNLLEFDWETRALSSSIPYQSLLILNSIQAIIAVFLASDFLKRDRKLDTTEAIYMRSMTNGDYVLGKTIGILVVFLLLNILILLSTGIINGLSKEVSLNLSAYLYYFLIISLPTLIYIFGISFLFMVVIRNQAVTFVVLLGYIALTLFYLGNKFNYLFDYMTYNIPLTYSDFIGFGNLQDILIHRGIYLFLGLGFIFATILLLKRLPQSRTLTGISYFFVSVFIIGGFFLGGVYINRLSERKEVRNNMSELNSSLINAPNISITDCTIDLSHRDKEIECSAVLLLVNNSNTELDNYIFTLNPGLIVQEVKRNNASIDFNREHHILTVSPSNRLLPNQNDSITILYKGIINEDVCYLDADSVMLQEKYNAGMLNIDKRHAFIYPNYVLLTSESLWYPSAGVSYSPDLPGLFKRDFINFSLNVKTSELLTPISQGQGSKLSEGEYSFIPEYPLPQISLIIGSYEKQSIRVDSIDYNLFILEGHDYFSSYFDELGDTLDNLIRKYKNDYELGLNLPYLFNRFSLVEVPIQFTSYPHSGTNVRDGVQPEMVFIPEKATYIVEADFKRNFRNFEWQIRKSNMVFLPKELQSKALSMFINATITSGASKSGFRWREGLNGVTITASNFISGELYTIYPNYFTYVYHFRSDRWPLMNIALETFLKHTAEDPMEDFYRGFTGLSDAEEANLALINNSLKNMLKKNASYSLISKLIESKSNYIFTLLQSYIGNEELIEFLNEMLEKNKFRVLDIEEFNRELINRFQFDLIPFIEEWYSNDKLPGYLITDISAREVHDEEKTRYLIKFKVSNPEPASGLLSVFFRLGGEKSNYDKQAQIKQMGMGASDLDLERIIYLEPNQAKEISIVLDGKPRVMTVNTLISQNLPVAFLHHFEEILPANKTRPVEGERIVDCFTSLLEPNEIVVDNEDPGFEIIEGSSSSSLRKLLGISPGESDKQYEALSFWWAPYNWEATIQSGFYGKYIRSAVYTRAGSGERKVAWKTKITEKGYYDIYCHAINTSTRKGKGGENTSEYNHYTIYHDEGIDETILDILNIEPGWNFLGTFYLSPDSAKVELTNKSEGRTVVADAIKWVLQ